MPGQTIDENPLGGLIGKENEEVPEREKGDKGGGDRLTTPSQTRLSKGPEVRSFGCEE